MNYYRFPENRLVRICFPLVLLLLQMVARSTMFTSTFLGFTLSQGIMIGLVLLIGIAFLVVQRKNLEQIFTDRRMLLFVGAAMIILGPMVLKQDWQAMYFTILLCWFFAIFLTYFTTVEELGKWYVLLMTFLSLYSLVGIFVLKPMVHMGLIPGNPFDSPGGWHMFNFGLTFVVDQNNHYDDAMRAFGIFREPGLYQIFLFIAIQLNNYKVEWKKQWKMWAVNGVLFATMLTTFATGGVFALGLYMVFLFFDKGLYRDKRLRIAALVLIVAAAVFLMVALEAGGTWAYELVGMVEKVFDKTYSYTSRVEAIFVDMKIFLENPLFGEKLETVVYSVDINTATTPILLAAFGAVFGCVHVLSWAVLVWKKERHVLMNLILMGILFIPFNTQNVIADQFFWLFPIMALAETGLLMMNKVTKKG